MSEWIATADCESCTELYDAYYKEGYEIKPPCKTCFPGVHSYNEAILLMYRKCSSQMILGMDGPVSLDIKAFELIYNSLVASGILKKQDDFMSFFDNVQSLFNDVIAIHKRRAKIKSKNKNKGK